MQLQSWDSSNIQTNSALQLAVFSASSYTTIGSPKARVDQVKQVNFEKNHFKVLCYFCCLLSLVIKITVIFEEQLFLTPKYVYLKQFFVLELFFFFFLLYELAHC